MVAPPCWMLGLAPSFRGGGWCSVDAATQDTARERAGVIAAVDHHVAVDDHRRDADGVAVWIRVGGLIGDARGVEDRYVRAEAGTQDATIGQPERARGAAG